MARTCLLRCDHSMCVFARAWSCFLFFFFPLFRRAMNNQTPLFLFFRFFFENCCVSGKRNRFLKTHVAVAVFGGGVALLRCWTYSAAEEVRAHRLFSVLLLLRNELFSLFIFLLSHTHTYPKEKSSRFFLSLLEVRPFFSVFRFVS